MTKDKLAQAISDIKEHRDDVIGKLVQFSKTDSLLFWDKNSGLAQKQEQLWAPVLKWADKTLNVGYVANNDLNVNEQSDTSAANLKKFMEDMDDKELAAFYLASINMKSELLAAALVKGEINAEQAYKAAYLEELYQAERWGIDDLAEQRRQVVKNELSDIEQFLRK
ncbi:MAG: hypothetical protein IJ689_05410 [Alphaproteobacteria bacterium]|nr:hypothetical protein [Alphaproteobacteria bacterium]